MNINVVVLSGNLTRDPEIKDINGQPLARLRLAVNKGIKRDGEWSNVPMYFDVDVWGGQAEVCGKYLAKGSHVTIYGRLDWREWQTDAGEKRQAVSVTAQGVELPPKRDEEQRRQGTPAAAPPDPEPPRDDIADEDIPF